MSTRILILVFFLATLLSGCGSESSPPTKGELKTLETACDKANEGKRVAVEGYLMLPDQFTGETSVMLRIQSQPDRNQQAVVATGVKIDKEGKAPNSMDNLGTSYSDEQLKVRTADGQVLGYQDKVLVSGTVYFPSSVATVEFTCGLSNPLIEKAE